jgi:HEAT repeat protein
MGFLDFLFDKEKAQDRRVRKLRKTLTNMYVQPPERKYAIQTLREVGTEDAVLALLARFEDNAPNTTVDADEKNYVYETLVGMSADPDLDVRGIIVDYLRGREEKINWPMKVLTDLLDYEEMIGLVRELLESCGADYQRNPEKKQELILRSAELRDEELTRELLRFVDDLNETIRFLTVEALLKHGFDEIIEEPLRERLREEDSIRISRKLAEAFAEHKDWKVPDPERDDVEHMLPDEFALHKEGYIYQRRA